MTHTVRWFTRGILALLLVVAVGIGSAVLAGAEQPKGGPLEQILAALGVLEENVASLGAADRIPAWDRKLPCATPATCERFRVLSDFNDEAVLDIETGLVWERSPDAAEILRWEGVIHCMERRTGGRMGWRLPSVQELSSLIDPEEIPQFSSSPRKLSVPPGHPFNTEGFTFLSTSVVGAPFGPADGGFTSFSMELGIIQTGLPRELSDRTWCVRGVSSEGLAF
jgi:hypothetical protein